MPIHSTWRRVGHPACRPRWPPRLRDQSDHLVERWSTCRGRFPTDDRPDRSPFLLGEDHIACQIRARPPQHRQPVDPPRHDQVQRQAGEQPIGTLQLDVLDSTSTLVNPKENLNRPAAGVIVHHQASRRERVHRQAGQQQPFDRLDPGGGRFLANPDRVDGHRRQLTPDTSRRFQRHRRRADRHGRLPRRAVRRTGHLHLQPAQGDAGRHHLSQFDERSRPRPILRVCVDPGRPG